MSQETDTCIAFGGLKPGRYNYRFALDKAFFESFENDEIKDAAVVCEVEMERLEHTLVIKTRLDGTLTVLCDRCLGQMTMRVDGDEQLCVRFSDSEQSDADDVAILPTESTEIDLAQWLYEYAAVRIPLQHSHPEGECDPDTVRFLESPATQEGEPTVDPRWQALEALKNK